MGLLHLTRTHLLLAGNDTVPISTLRGVRMHSTEFRLVVVMVGHIHNLSKNRGDMCQVPYNR